MSSKSKTVIPFAFVSLFIILVLLTALLNWFAKVEPGLTKAGSPSEFILSCSLRLLPSIVFIEDGSIPILPSLPIRIPTS